MTEQPATTRDLEHAITTATAIIRATRALLLDTTTGSHNIGSASTDDVTALDKRISLALEVDATLAHWCAQIRDRRPVTHGLPGRNNTPGMLEFIDRHAAWLSGQHDAPTCVDQLRDHAQQMRAVTIPRRRTHVHLGSCPLPHPDDPDQVCAGRVRARIGAADNTATCTSCHTTRSIAWWQWELGLSKPPLTGEAMARVLRQRMGVTVTGQTIRNWARQGLIDAYLEPFGPVPQWPRFDQEVVMLQVAQMGRACAMCGQPWHGAGDLCTRCYVDVHSRRPTRAPVKRPTPVRGGRPAYRPQPGPSTRLLDEHGQPVKLAWCDRGDMPAVWCGCGADHQGTG